MIKTDIINSFLDLVKIPSPSGKEKAIAAYIINRLEKAKIAYFIDNASKFTKSEVGNIHATILGKPGSPSILFVAHMDTVVSGNKRVIPIIENQRIHTSKRGVLGADNKASIAVLLELLGVAAKFKKIPTMHVLFTTTEEKGRMGVRYANLPQVDYIFNLDGQGPVGRFAIKALGHLPFQITIHGRSAHAAQEPEKGVHAILLAGKLLSSLPYGKDREGNTHNIGVILGGKDTNVVPDKVVLKGEMRSFSKETMGKMKKNIQEIIKVFGKDNRCKCTIRYSPDQGAPPLNGDLSSELVDFVKEICEKMRITFEMVALSGTTEANFLASSNIPVINVCRGGKFAHSVHEEITKSELYSLFCLLREIISLLSVKVK